MWTHSSKAGAWSHEACNAQQRSMSVRKLRASWWVDFRHAGTRYRMRCPEKSRTGALAYEADLRRRLSLGLALGQARTDTPQDRATHRTFAEHSAHWLATYVTSNNKPSSARDTSTILRLHLLPHFDSKSCGDISTDDVEKLKKGLLNTGRSPKTINNILTVLRSCLKAAEEDKIIDALPKIKLLRLPPRTFDFLTFEEAEQILSAPMPVLWKVVILCALRTGMRRGEICGLQWTDVNLVARTITIRHSLVEGLLGSPKNYKWRVIPIEDELALWLTDGPGP